MQVKNNTNAGFTIVELLIVIVVIAILAAISIVAYTGIQNRGKTSSGQTNASQVAKKAEVAYSLDSAYPANVAGFTNEAALTGLTVVNYSGTDTNAGYPGAVGNYSDGTKVIYRRVNANGGCVYYWDYQANNEKGITFGSQASCQDFAAP